MRTDRTDVLGPGPETETTQDVLAIVSYANARLMLARHGLYLAKVRRGLAVLPKGRRVLIRQGGAVVRCLRLCSGLGRGAAAPFYYCPSRLTWYAPRYIYTYVRECFLKFSTHIAPRSLASFLYS